MKKIIAVILAVAIVIGVGTFFAVRYFKAKPGKNNQTEVDAEQIVASYSDITLGDTLFYSINKHPDRWGNSLVSVYGMSEEKKTDIIETPENWLAFNLFINVDNFNDRRIIVSGIDVPANGKNGMYFQSILDGQHVIEKNVTAQVVVYFFVNNNDLSLEEVEQMVKNLDIYVKYVPMPDDIEEEIPEEAYQKAEVRF